MNIHRQNEKSVFALAENPIFDSEKTAPMESGENLWSSALAKFRSFILSVYTLSRRTIRKRPFALAEVCVAIGIVGIATTYIFSSLHESIRRYGILRDGICCNELADEYLAQGVAQFLTDPPEFDAVAQIPPRSVEVGAYTVSLYVSLQQEKRTSEEDTSSIEKDPVALIEFLVTVRRSTQEQKIASRSTLLCVCKEGA